MNQLLQMIHSVNDYERTLFQAKQEQVSPCLDRWYSDLRPDQMNNNFFLPKGRPTCLDIDTAIGLQKQRGLHYVMLRMAKPMEPELRELFPFEEEITYIMALLRDTSSEWKQNGEIEIRDIQTADIRADLLDVSSVPQPYQAAAYRNMQLVLEVAKENPDYHWLCAYKGGQKVGTVYALCRGGYVEMDDLWVAKEHRNQYIATTLLKYIAQQFGGTLYLHANAAATPKDMYARMGFEIVETVYEYYMEWA